ncbi:thiol-disulfide oxidoreductase DCC family protein [Leptospira sp. WS60.C2]
MPLEKRKIVFFDGVCHLCMGSVQFLLKQNKKESLFFSAIGSETFQTNLLAQKKQGLPDSIVYWNDGNVYVESDAILSIAKELRFPWNLAVVFWIVPRVIRNWVYRWIARHRYEWFGKAESCMVPSPEVKRRFLD